MEEADGIELLVFDQSSDGAGERLQGYWEEFCYETVEDEGEELVVSEL